MQDRISYQHLQPEDRIAIASMRQQDDSVGTIARTLHARLRPSVASLSATPRAIRPMALLSPSRLAWHVSAPSVRRPCSMYTASTGALS
ncbi:helix-turn-helix domain-containing protein [Variovorax sp. RB2P76]|uniref:helix-turn-helix domain-containing protein n=1 Tax=unclassified Variovorax TaxID=663243 RepID=UPI003F481F67